MLKSRFEKTGTVVSTTVFVVNENLFSVKVWKAK